ncbi:uncharacterized protein [Triticum aestivum]|uniref:uncharacterized protein n=1 Tax=Triticum aestivum TaxID=4565 RepID=UPI001D017F41|nr:uncharacterized protein LOC123188053 [Triticum aestivum]
MPDAIAVLRASDAGWDRYASSDSPSSQLGSPDVAAVHREHHRPPELVARCLAEQPPETPARPRPAGSRLALAASPLPGSLTPSPGRAAHSPRRPRPTISWFAKLPPRPWPRRRPPESCGCSPPTPIPGCSAPTPCCITASVHPTSQFTHRTNQQGNRGRGSRRAEVVMGKENRTQKRIDLVFKRKRDDTIEVEEDQVLPLLELEQQQPEQQHNQDGGVRTNEVVAFRGIEFLQRDPGLRPQIWQYPPDQRDIVRRAYLMLGPMQPRLENFIAL